MPEKVKGSLIFHASLYKNVRLAFVALSIDPTVHDSRRMIDALFFPFACLSFMYCIQQHGVSCGSSLGVVTAACLLCARVLLSAWFKEIQKRSATRRRNTRAELRYDALNLNLFLSHGRQRSCLAPYSGQPSSRNYVIRVRRGGSHREPPYRKSRPRFVRGRVVNLARKTPKRFVPCGIRRTGRDRLNNDS